MEEMYQECIDKWGVQFQLLMLQEECAELIQASVHYIRNRDNKTCHLLEEIVDVELLIGQVKRILNSPDQYKNIRARKIKRLKSRLFK